MGCAGSNQRSQVDERVIVSDTCKGDQRDGAVAKTELEASPVSQEDVKLVLHSGNVEKNSHEAQVQVEVARQVQNSVLRANF